MARQYCIRIRLHKGDLTRIEEKRELYKIRRFFGAHLTRYYSTSASRDRALNKILETYHQKKNELFVHIDWIAL